MRIMREVLTDITKKDGRTVLISSHILGELEKIATHYGIIRHGQMVKEMTAQELEDSCRTYIALKTGDLARTKRLLQSRYTRVEEDESGYLRIYNLVPSEEVVRFLYENGIVTSEIKSAKINLEEYYIDLMQEREGR